MMDYEIFKEVVREKFMDYLPEEYRDMKLIIAPIDRVNHTVDGINLIGEKDGRAVSSTIYINKMYEHYKVCNDLAEVLKNSADDMIQIFKICPKAEEISYENVKKNIVFQLVNTEQNKEMLEEVPHRQMQDLSIIYRWMKMEGDMMHSAIVGNSMAEMIGLDEEQLFGLAAENTKEIFPPTIQTLNEVVSEIFAMEEMQDDMMGMFTVQMPAESMVYVISNDRKLNGAASMLYENELHNLAMKTGSDLYILPSSIHEVLAVPAFLGEPNELAEMVAEVNMTQVSLEERLSNQVYLYDKDLRKLSLATDTPNKRLDGIMAEPSMVYETKPFR